MVKTETAAAKEYVIFKEAALRSLLPEEPLKLLLPRMVLLVEVVWAVGPQVVVEASLAAVGAPAVVVGAPASPT